MLLGSYDLLIVAIIIAANAMILSFNKDNCYRHYTLIVASICYLFVFPHLSVKLEVNTLLNQNIVIDGSNRLIFFFRYPIYWLLGLLNLGFFNWLKATTPLNQLNKQLKIALSISAKVKSPAVFNYQSAEDFHLTLTNLQNELENKNLIAIEKLIPIFEPDSEWDNIIGDTRLGEAIRNLLAEVNSEFKRFT